MQRKYATTSLLKSALKLERSPTFSEVEKLVEAARNYQERENEIFLYAKRRERVKILNEALFFRFLRETTGTKVQSFDEIRQILQSRTRRQNVLHYGDSKRTSIAPFARTVLLRSRGDLPKIYRESELPAITEWILAVENAESFLDAEVLYKRFDTPYHLYLGGNPNRLTQEFMQDKRVLFFVDYDIVSMNFFETVVCREKKLYLPQNLEHLLQDHGNRSLYQKQRGLLKDRYHSEAGRVIAMIRRHAKVLEQEGIG